MSGTLITPISALHAQSGPHALNVSGGLFDANGQPVQRGGINFKLEVRDKTGSCVLYSETHDGEDLSNTKGQFSLLLGSGTTPQNYLSGGATLDASVFLNRGVTGAFTGCPAGVTLASGDERVIRVYYDLGAGLTAMTPDVPIVSSAYAMVADTLQGKRASEFIQVKDDGATASLNQANVEEAFSFANWPKLKALIDGTSSSYLPVGGTSPLDMNNQRIIRVANPGTSPFDAVNKGYADANIGGRTADFTGVGPAIGDGKTMIWDQAAQKWVAGNPTITGTAGGDLSGSYPNPVIASNAVTTAKVADNAITSAKINTTGVAINRLVATDATTGSTLTYFTCAVGEIMWWTATGWQCTTVAAQAPVKTVAGKTPNAAGNVALNAADISGLGTIVTKDFGSAAGEVPLLDAGAKIPAYMLPTGTGTITAVTAVAPVLGGGTTGNVTISLDVGTAANQVVRLNGSAQLPAVDGSLLTGVNASRIGTRAVSSAAPGASQVLGYNATLSQWEPMSAATGSVTAIVNGTGLVAGTITSAGTINVDVGTTAGQIVQFDGSARYPANDGSLITNVNATKLGTRAVASLAPGASQVLGYNATSSQWEPMTDGGGTVVSVVSGTGLVAGTITASGTLNVDVGTAAGKIVQLNGSAQIPAVDGSLLTGVNATKIGTRIVASSAPSSSQVLTWNGSQWEPANASSTLSWPLTATPGTTPAGAPSYSFSGSTNTGLFSQATNTLALATAGTTALTIDTNGNLGVGTTQPGALLHVVGGSIASTATSNNAFGSNLSLQKGRGAGLVQANDELGYLSFMGHDGAVYRQGAYLLGAVDGTASASSMPTRMIFATTATGATTSTERMRIDSLGRVGIGTASPLSILDVAATGTNSALILPRDIQANRPAANAANGMIRYNTSTSKFEGYENGAWVNMTAAGAGSGDFKSDGSVAMSAAIRALGGTAGAPGYAFVGDTDTGTFSSTANTLEFATGGTARMSISPSGYVGIGVASPAVPLEVANNAAVSGSDFPVSFVVLNRSSTGAQYPSSIVLNYAGTSAGYPVMMVKNARGSQGTPAALVAGDTLGSYGAQGYIGGAWSSGAAMQITASENYGAGAAGADVRFYTTKNGTNAGVERVRLQNDGNLGIGTTTPLAALDVATTGTNSAVVVPRDTQANRPSSNVANGMMRYNTSTSRFEAYENGAWTNMIAAGGGTTSFPLLAAPGTTPSSAPSYSFSGSTNTGFYSPGAGKVAFSTAGTQRFVMDNGGDTTISTYNLHLNQVDTTVYATAGSGAVMPNGGVFVRAENASPTDGSYAGFSMQPTNTATNAQTAYVAAVANATGYAPSIIFGQSLTGNSYAERMRLDAKGNLGVGTTAPVAVLDLAVTGTNSALVLPRDTTAARPAANVANGMIRYNTSTSKFEAYENGGWTNMISAGGGTTSFPLLALPGTTPESAPSYAFSGNANTGLFSQATNNVALATNGTARLTVGSTGNVGIGTSAPSERLVSVGDDAAWGLMLDNSSSDGASNQWRMAATGAGWGAGDNAFVLSYDTGYSNQAFLTLDGANGMGTFRVQDRAVATNIPSFGLLSTSTAGQNVGPSFGFAGADGMFADRTFAIIAGKKESTSNSNYAGYFTIGTRPDGGGITERLRVSSIGNVGVGTTSPQAGLDVATTGTLASALIVPRDTQTNRPSTAVNGMIRYNTSTAKFETYENGAWSNVISAGGGTASFPLLASPATTPASAPSYSFSGDGNTGFFSQAADTVAIATAGTARLTVLANGKVGVGTSSPSEALNVVTPSAGAWGLLHTAGTVSAGTWVSSTSAQIGTKSNTNLDFITNDSTPTMTLNTNGYLLVGNGFTPDYPIVAYESFNGKTGIKAYNPLNGTQSAAGVYSMAQGSVFGAMESFASTFTTSGIYQARRVVVSANTASSAIAFGSDGTAPALIFTNGTERARVTGTGLMGVGTNNPTVALDVTATGTTSALLVPRDTQANRPAGNVANGMIRYNTSTAKFEAYENGGWTNMIGGGGASTLDALTDARTTGGTDAFYLGAGVGASSTAAENTGVGALALQALSTGTENTALGAQALRVNAAGSYNTALGAYALQQNDGSNNTAVGDDAMTANIYGGGNTALGTNALINMTYGNDNVAIGSFTGQGATSNMYRNVIIGASAANQLGTSSSNVIIGAYAGTTPSTIVDSNILIGQDTQAPGASSSYALNIGNTIFGNLTNKRVNIGSKTLTLGAALEVTSQGTIASTLLVPRDTTANRPGTGVNGMLRYNTSTSKFEAFENGGWANMIGAGSVSFPLAASPGTTPASAPSYSFTGSTTTGLSAKRPARSRSRPPAPRA